MVAPADVIADSATAYARGVAEGRIIAGPHVRHACARHLDDLQFAHSRGFYWDAVAAEHVISFFAIVLRLNGGEHEGEPFILEAWQCFIIGSLFGWKRLSDGYRRFRTAFIETGKGSGKSPLLAGVGIYMTCADGEPRAEVYAAATKRDQAMVLFRDAIAMVDQSIALYERFTTSGTAGNEHHLAYLAENSFFKPIATEDRGKGQSGPRPHCALLDEVHEHATNAMVEFMRAGVKGRRQPLILMITNSGVDRTSVCFEYHDYGAQVSASTRVDDEFFAYICACDEGEDPINDEDDPELGYPLSWAKTNPSIGVTFKPDYLRGQVLSARGMPSKESLVRRLNFCEWVDAINPWIDGDMWRQCETQLDLSEFEGRPCYLALDLSQKRDLTACAAVWRSDDGSLDAIVWFWTPKDTLQHRSDIDRVPYPQWERDEHLFAVPGKTVKYGFVVRHLAEHVLARFGATALAFDQWHIDDFISEMDNAGEDSYIWEGPEAPQGAGVMMVRHGQGTGGGASEHVLWMPRSIGVLEEKILTGALRVQKNPVLTWNSASAVLASDPAGNKKWEKRKSTGRIDGVVALSMAVGLAETMASHGSSEIGVVILNNEAAATDEELYDDDGDWNGY